MLTVQGYYENDTIQLLEPVLDPLLVGKRSRVAVIFLDTYSEAPAATSVQLKTWGEDEDSQEQAALLRSVRDELAPYSVRALEVAAQEDDWEAILG